MEKKEKLDPDVAAWMVLMMVIITAGVTLGLIENSADRVAMVSLIAVGLASIILLWLVVSLSCKK